MLPVLEVPIWYQAVQPQLAGKENIFKVPVQHISQETVSAVRRWECLAPGAESQYIASTGVGVPSNGALS